MEYSKNQKKIYRVGIDARFFGLENKGLGRYTNELVEGLDKLLLKKNKINNNLNIEYYIFILDDKFREYQPKSKKIHKVKVKWRWYSFEEQIFLPFVFYKYQLDLLHFPHFNIPLLYRRKFIVTIHDLILFHYPTIRNTNLSKIFYFIKLGMYHLIIRSVVKRAEKIIAISKFTKNDLRKNLKVPDRKMKIIYEGADFTINCQNKYLKTYQQENIFEKYGIIKPYLLYVGNAYPHKNLEKLVLAWKKFQQEQNKETFQLVLVGKKDFFYKNLNKFIKQNKIKNIIITDHITSFELEYLYSHSSLFIFPSLYEGFGLPPLEALLQDVKVVSSNKGSLPEILGNKVDYFNPNSIEDIIKAIKNGLSKTIKPLSNNEKLKIEKKYNWQKTVRITNNLYEELLSKKKN